MAYAEKVPAKGGDYWRGRYKDPSGRYLTVRDEQGDVIRYGRKKDAEAAAEEKEASVRHGTWINPDAGAVLFRDWSEKWWLAGQDLAESTIANRKRHLEDHLIPFFGETSLAEIDAELIGKWKREERASGYAEDSIRTWHGTLHTCLEDAVGTHVKANPATVKRGRGRRSGSGRRSASRGPEKVITTTLGILLIAERMSILTGRDDELVMIETGYWDQLRLGELVGLWRKHAGKPRLRVETQQHEVEGRLLAQPPKDDSYGTLDQPPFLVSMLTGFMAASPLPSCPCHGQAHVFRGYGKPRVPRGTVAVSAIAGLAGVSATTASAVLYQAGGSRVSEEVALRVLAAAADAGWEKVAVQEDPAWHWRRSSFEELFSAAASGRLPARRPLPGRPVPLEGEWPGTRVRGRNAQARATLAWEPVAEGMTPHGWRHSGKSHMEEWGISEVLSEQRMRHDIPGVSGRYRHVTRAMTRELIAAMTAAHEDALDKRLEMSPRSPVAVLDSMLAERAEARKPKLLPRNSPETAAAVLPFEGRTASDLRRGDWI